MEKRKYLFASVAILVSAALMLIAGVSELSGAGLVMSIIGAIDFLFLRKTLNGFIISEAYGEAGESLWEFRSFVLMVGGPLLILTAIIFG